ncbi:hypothetical protein KUTeg_016279 [Tegillarca granosa]|uniref:SH2 domain-containing protein n=1 Tax=Tegillarca granosa TaxID=220873 RepID=A0ABQ9EKE5_TEGGR|nr:hypothetical protein KUTeg_016279 [Tegillarca granosa]
MIIKEIQRSNRKKQPPPKKGLGYDLVSNFFQHSFLAPENGDAYICVRCANRLRNIVDLRKKKGKLEQELLKSSQRLKPYTENVVVLYDFKAVKDDELEAFRGDRCEVLHHRSHLPEWHFVKNVATNTSGYIPQIYISRDDGSPQTEDWWQNVDRKEAEKILMKDGNKKGTFLVRKSSDGSTYVLSVLDTEEEVMTVAHYQIFQIEKVYRISTSIVYFPVLLN